MGIDLISAAIAIPNGLAPSWGMAERWIKCLERTVLIDTGDDLFPIEDWAEGASEPGSWEVDVMTAARPDLRERTSRVRAAIERPAEAGVLVVSLSTHRVFVASDVDMGGPVQLVDDFIYFAESGIAMAAGFSHWTEFASRPLAERLSPEMEPLSKWKPARAIAAARELEACQDPAEWIAWLTAIELDWEVARSHLGKGQEATELADDLDFLRAVVEEYSIRMVSSIEIDGLTLWTIADYGSYGGRAVESICRLGEARTLDAAGFIGWGVPARSGIDENP